MKEKIYEIPLDHNLTLARKRKLESCLKEYAPQSPWKIRHEWDDSNRILHLTTQAVTWELIFHPGKLEVYGSGPFWARMLFTSQLKTKLLSGITHVLRQVGLLDSEEKAKPAPRRRAKPRA